MSLISSRPCSKLFAYENKGGSFDGQKHAPKMIVSTGSRPKIVSRMVVSARAAVGRGQVHRVPHTCPIGGRREDIVFCTSGENEAVPNRPLAGIRPDDRRSDHCR